MFWNREARQLRRQSLLDELSDLEPEELRARLDRAVLEGDIHADEVNQLLRIRSRVDEMRVMIIPSVFRLSAPDQLIGLPASTPSAADGVTEIVKHTPWRKRRARARGRVAIDITPDDTVAQVAAPMALVAATADQQTATQGSEPAWPDISWLLP